MSWERGRPPVPGPLVSAEHQCDSAGRHHVGSNRNGPAEGGPKPRCRSIQMEEMAQSVGLCAGGTPALPGRLHPQGEGQAKQPSGPQGDSLLTYPLLCYSTPMVSLIVSTFSPVACRRARQAVPNAPGAGPEPVKACFKLGVLVLLALAGLEQPQFVRNAAAHSPPVTVEGALRGRLALDSGTRAQQRSGLYRSVARFHLQSDNPGIRPYPISNADVEEDGTFRGGALLLRQEGALRNTVSQPETGAGEQPWRI